MRKWKGFIYIKVLAVIIFAASIVAGTYSVVVLSGDGPAVADVLEGKSDREFEQDSSYAAAVSYYKKAFENYLKVRQLLGIDESGKLDYDQAVMYSQNTRESDTLSDIMEETGNRGEVYESLSSGYGWLSEGVVLHDDTVKSCIREWNKLRNYGLSIDGETWVFADGTMEKGERVYTGKEYPFYVVNNLIQCYDFYMELFEQDSNFSYVILDYGKCRQINERYTGDEYKAYKAFIVSAKSNAGYLAVYDPYEKEAESDILGISAEDLRYDTRYLGDNSIEPGKNGTSLATEIYDKKNLVAIAVSIDSGYEKDDVFKTLYEKYNASHQRARKYVPDFVSCTGWAFSALLFLLFACGRKMTVEENGEEKTRYVLCREEKWFTEIFFFGFLASAVFTLYCINGMVFESRWDFHDSHDVDVLLATSILSALILFSTSLFFYNVKKIKAGRFFKDTVAGRLAHSCKDEHGNLYRWIENKKNFFRNMGEDKKGIKKILFFDLTRLACVVVVLIFGIFVLDGWYYSGIRLAVACFFFVILEIIAYLYLTVKFRKWIITGRAADRDIVRGAGIIADGNLEYKLKDEDAIEIRKELIDVINRIGEGLANAVADGVKSERMKTELITNVSHDIKTPLTSVINYVDLLKRENIEDEKIQGYLEVLDSKSQRLKILIEDLIEASKASSGAIQLIMGRLNFNELVHQTDGEFAERFAQKNLTVVSALAQEPLIIEGDGRRIYRILENLYQNVSKYAMEGTRVYVELRRENNRAAFTIKNISKEPLNISAEELTERFVRGEESRTTEGSGLGLSIAKSLTELHKGDFEIYLDGDLFRVTVTFPLYGE